MIFFSFYEWPRNENNIFDEKKYELRELSLLYLLIYFVRKMRVYTHLIQTYSNRSHKFIYNHRLI